MHAHVVARRGVGGVHPHNMIDHCRLYKLVKSLLSLLSPGDGREDCTHTKDAHLYGRGGQQGGVCNVLVCD